jgi:hypothetical protein
MAREALLADCTRVCHNGDRILVQVQCIEWDGPHTPVARWVTAKQLDVATEAKEIETVRRALLDDPQYFLTCELCKRHNQTGHTHRIDGKIICHGCCERHLGIVH